MEGLKEGGVRMFCVGFVLQKRGVAKNRRRQGSKHKKRERRIVGGGG